MHLYQHTEVAATVKVHKENIHGVTEQLSFT